MTLWEFSTGAATVATATDEGGANILVRFWRHLRRRMRVAAARDELGSMSDETLRDLGLSRCQLDYIAEQITDR